jgi:leucyl aminopeptidase (aminopeptidase T)
MDPVQAARNALTNVLDAVSGEKIIVICDSEKDDIGQAFVNAGLKLGLWTRLVLLTPGDEVRADVPAELREILVGQVPNIYINLFRGNSEETPFRIKVIKLENRNRIRLGHCPGITIDMLTEGAMALDDEEYRDMQSFASELLKLLEGTVKIRITNPQGTDLVLSVKGREFFTDTQLNWKTLKWMNLPVGEVIVGPIENSLEGTLVCNTAIGGLGLIDQNKPMTIKVRSGKAEEVNCEDDKVLAKVNEALNTDKWSASVGEFAFGLNPKARLTAKEFLEIEKVNKTVHIAFGNNIDFPGGKNPAKNHMDFLISEPTVEIEKVNGKKIIVMEQGNYKI